MPQYILEPILQRRSILIGRKKPLCTYSSFWTLCVHTQPPHWETTRHKMCAFRLLLSSSRLGSALMYVIPYALPPFGKKISLGQALLISDKDVNSHEPPAQSRIFFVVTTLHFFTSSSVGEVVFSNRTEEVPTYVSSVYNFGRFLPSARRHSNDQGFYIKTWLPTRTASFI